MMTVRFTGVRDDPSAADRDADFVIRSYDELPSVLDEIGG
jgi:hypothetical protein